MVSSDSVVITTEREQRHYKEESVHWLKNDAQPDICPTIQ